MERTFRTYGRPEALYSDRHLILQPLKELTVLEQLEGKQQSQTQFSRAMNELNIRMIRAYSAEAKGRIERLWETLQSRLPIEFKINNIETVEEANKFLVKYVNKHNKRFGINDKNISNIFRSMPEEIDLKYVLCRKERRKLNTGCTFSIYNRIFKVQTNEIPYNVWITILISKKTGIMVEYKGKQYKTELFEDRRKDGQYDTITLLIDEMLKESLKDVVNF